MHPVFAQGVHVGEQVVAGSVCERAVSGLVFAQRFGGDVPWRGASALVSCTKMAFGIAVTALRLLVAASVVEVFA